MAPGDDCRLIAGARMKGCTQQQVGVDAAHAERTRPCGGHTDNMLLPSVVSLQKSAASGPLLAPELVPQMLCVGLSLGKQSPTCTRLGNLSQSPNNFLGRNAVSV